MADEAVFSDHIFTTNFQEEFKKHWKLRHDFKSTNLEIVSKPFRVCRISNFLRNEKFIENLMSELENEGHSRSLSDLYKNEKSNELRGASGNHIQMLYDSLQKDISVWMNRNTGIHLEGDISMRSVRYYDTDHLLCHDDHTEIRRIAFILYLTKDWTEEDGGTLDLFNADEYGAPTNVVKSLIPEYNSLVFFEVVDNSYHQVAEIKSNHKCRWALSGWFLGLEEHYRRLRRFNTIVNYIQPNITKVTLDSWISKTYLLPNIKSDIQNDVERDSYVFLGNFLVKSVYQKIMKDLISQDISWKMVGPADIRHYEIADEETLPELLKEFYNLFKSISFFQLLENYTDLELMPRKKKKTKPKMTIELQRWSAGCYTLLYNRFLMENLSDASKEAVQTNDPSSIASTSNTLIDDETTPNAGKTHQELKRKKTDPPSPKTAPREEKVAKRLDTQSDVSTQSPSTNEHDMNKNSLPEDDSFRSGTPANENSDSEKSEESYLLDVIMQFNTRDAENMPKTEETIDYIDPEHDNTLIQFPPEDNHLALVFRSLSVCRLQQYLNHYYKGYSYALVCEYHE